MLQGFVLGPSKFIAYTEDRPAVVENHNVDPYLFADDRQLIELLSDVGAAIPKMENCVDAVHKWCASRRL